VVCLRGLRHQRGAYMVCVFARRIPSKNLLG
jgi:hypothetical protein